MHKTTCRGIKELFEIFRWNKKRLMEYSPFGVKLSFTNSKAENVWFNWFYLYCCMCARLVDFTSINL